MLSLSHINFSLAILGPYTGVSKFMEQSERNFLVKICFLRPDAMGPFKQFVDFDITASASLKSGNALIK